MKFRLIAVALALSLVAILPITGCAKKAPNLTPSAQVVLDLNIALDVAKALAADNTITAASYAKMSTAHDQIVKLIGASGWQAKADAVLDALKADLTAAEYAKLQPYLVAARAAVDAYPAS